MQATITEAKANLGHYVRLAQKEDVIILKRGKQVARLVGQQASRIDAAKALIGLFANPVDWDAERLERLDSGSDA
jgi:prevent-host-death family protein